MTMFRQVWRRLRMLAVCTVAAVLVSLSAHGLASLGDGARAAPQPVHVEQRQSGFSMAPAVRC